jgi:hypothetical protein
METQNTVGLYPNPTLSLAVSLGKQVDFKYTGYTRILFINQENI